MANPPQLFISTKRVPIQVHIQSSVLTATQDGSDPPTAASDDVPTNATSYAGSLHSNYVVEAFGKRFFLYQNTIRERDQGGSGVYGIVYTFANTLNTGIGGTSGIHVIHVNGQEVVALLYHTTDATTRLKRVWSDDGTNWNEADAANQTFNTNSNTGVCRSYGSSLLWIMDGLVPTTSLFIYDFELDTATQITTRPGGSANATEGNWEIYIYGNKIFLCTPYSTRVSRLEGLTWVNVYQISADFPSAIGMRNALFTDPATGDLIVIVEEKIGTPQGSKVIQIKGALTKSGLNDSSPTSDIVNLTLTVLPPLLLANSKTGAGGTGTHANSTHDYYRTFVDNITTPGTPVIFLAYSTSTTAGIPTSGGTHNWYQWNGVSSLMTLVGAGPTSEGNWYISETLRGGGERIPTIGAARPVWDGAILLTHGAVTNGPFVVGEAVTSSGTGVGVIETLYTGEMAINVTSGLFLNTEVITGSPSTAFATLSADSLDLSTPTEEAGGKTKVFFRVRGTGSAINLQVYYNDGSEAPDTLMGLATTTVAVVAGTPATTPTNNTTQISNVTPDGGSAIYSINLETTSAGILSGQGYSLMLVPV